MHSLLVVVMLIDVSAFCDNDGSAECSEMNFLQLGVVHADKDTRKSDSRMHGPAVFDNISACLSAVLPLLEKTNTGCFEAHEGQVNECGDISRNQEQQNTYVRLASQPSVSTICETGFFNGVSSATWLCANPNAKVFNFDLEPPHENVKIIKDFFGHDRFTMTEGDSTVTLAAFAANSSSPFCDIMVADGGHFGDVPFSDTSNFAKIAAKAPSRKHVFLVDEVYFDNPGNQCCMDVTASFEKGMSLNMFDIDASRCRPFECEMFLDPECIQTGDPNSVESLPLVGDKTLNSTYPLGGYCILKFDAEYLKSAS